MRHVYSKEGLMGRYAYSEEGLTVRHIFNEEGLMGRHTPAFGHPSPRGDGLTHHIDNQQLSMVRRRAIPSRRGVPRSGGVCRTISPSTPQTYRPLKRPLLPSPNSVSALHQHRLLSACCPLDVRLLSALKADNKRTSSGQQADNKVVRLMSACCPL